MTVEELIDKLNGIKDKDLEVFVWQDGQELIGKVFAVDDTLADRVDIMI